MTPMEGTCAGGFAPVRAVFEAGATDLAPGGGAFCVYAGGRKVVDLWTGYADTGVAWERDTICPILSATKAMTALCAQILWDRGALELDEPVATYWPDFAANGKEAITVRTLLSHGSGVVEVPGFEDLGAYVGDGRKLYEEICSRLAAAAPVWEPGSRHGYHVFTFGFLIGQLVLRISGQTLGAFFAQNVAEPLALDLWIGDPARAAGRRARLYPFNFESLPPDAAVASEPLLTASRDPSTTTGRAYMARDGKGIPDTLADSVNSQPADPPEMGTGDGLGPTRDLARMYAALSMGGGLDGRTVVSQESIRTFATVQYRGHDEVTLSECAWALGYQGNVARRFGPIASAFGHGGAGGQLGFCDPANA